MTRYRLQYTVGYLAPDGHLALPLDPQALPPLLFDTPEEARLMEAAYGFSGGQVVPHV